MKISSIMTKDVITVSPDDPIAEAVDLFNDAVLHHAPVITSEGEVVGMISSKDLENYVTIMRLMDSGTRPEQLHVRDLMTTPVFAYYGSTDLRQAARAMLDNHIHAVVVMDENDKMNGIITSTDIMMHIADGN